MGQIITTAKIVAGLLELIWSVWIAIVVVLAAGCGGRTGAGQAGPPTPYEDVGACPFEGCVYRAWVANAPVEIRADRNWRRRSPSIRAGEKVAALGGVVVTTRPGRVEFDMPHDVDASGGPIHVEPGQTLYLLTSEGEAT